MPTTVADALTAAELPWSGVVRWGERVPETWPGVYIVALTGDPATVGGTLPRAPLDRGLVTDLLATREDLTLDRERPSTDSLAARLAGFWLPDETIVYIGLAGTSVRNRVRQYYTTPLGARKPHVGGWWLKTLAALPDLWVHFAATPDNKIAERLMLEHFAAHLSPESVETLTDAANPAPFGNLRTGTGRIKSHGITGSTGDVAASPKSRHKLTSGAGSPRHERTTAVSAVESPTTQRVTAKDIEAGRLRFPRAAKPLFPMEKARISVTIRGQGFDGARWDPPTGPERERSGVLSFGKGMLDGLVIDGERLIVREAAGGVILN